MVNIIRRCNLMVDLSKFVSNKKILSKVVTKTTTNFVAKCCLYLNLNGIHVCRDEMAHIRIFGRRSHLRTSNGSRTDKYKRKQIDIEPRKRLGHDKQETLSEEQYHLGQ